MEHLMLYAVLGGTALFVLFCLRVVAYRLYAHPLASFPGPKLAAATFLYEFYYDVIKRGMHIWEIERMHEQYGPIVRINPRELHIRDPYYYEEIHAPGSRKRAKDPRYAVAFGAPYSLVGTISHDHHRLRRSFLNNYFSKRSVTNLTPMIHEKVDLLMRRFENAYHEGTVRHLQLDFAALTADVITHYSYGVSYGYLEDANSSRGNDLVDAVNGLMAMFHVNRFFPLLVTIFRATPPKIIRWVQPQMADLFDVKARLRQQAKDTLQKRTGDVNEKDHNNIFDALVSPNVPEHEITLDRLEDESALLLGAGTETTARTIAVSMFHLMDNPDMGRRLREELRTVMETPTSKASWTDLEKLPYLTGVVNEGLRLSHGMTARLARVSPNETMVYGDWVIPAGTPVSQSNYFVHMDPTLFPNPHQFNPERWIHAAERGEYLSRFIVAFTKGSRQCLGIKTKQVQSAHQHLAHAEIYLLLAHIMRRFEFVPYETTVDNISVYRELGVGYPKKGVFDVKARVVGIVEK